MRRKTVLLIVLMTGMGLCSYGRQVTNTEAPPTATAADDQEDTATDEPVRSETSPQPTPTSDAQRTAARSAAQRILQNREFRGLHEPGLKESLTDRVVDALLRFFSRILGHAPDLSVLSNVVVWGIVLLALAALCWWLWRVSKASFENPIPHVATANDTRLDIAWQEWLRLARSAAERGEYREAIHLGYWAGIAGMEQRGAWKPDRARTPREYLKLVSLDEYTALKSLTRELERTWYAQQAATLADFQNCLLQLERLGCQ
jgi:hypothetical protein